MFVDNFKAYYKDVLCEPEATANALVIDLEKAACSQVISSGFTSLPQYSAMGNVMEQCVKTLYEYNLTTAEKELGSVFYSSILCNYAVGVVFEPSSGELTQSYCYELLNPPASTIVQTVVNTEYQTIVVTSTQAGSTVLLTSTQTQLITSVVTETLPPETILETLPPETSVSTLATTIVETLPASTYTTTVETTAVYTSTLPGSTATETTEITSVYTTEVIVTQPASTFTTTVYVPKPYTVYQNQTKYLPITEVLSYPVSIPYTKTLPGTTEIDYIYKTYEITDYISVTGYISVPYTKTKTDYEISYDTEYISVPGPTGYITETKKVPYPYTETKKAPYPTTETQKVPYEKTIYVTVTTTTTEYKHKQPETIYTTMTVHEKGPTTTCYVTVTEKGCSYHKPDVYNSGGSYVTSKGW